MSQVNSKLRKVRLIQWGLIVSILISAGVAECVCGRGSADWTPLHWLVTGVALWAALAGFRLRHRLLRRSMETLAKDPVNSKGLKQWEGVNLFGLAMAAGVAMYGQLVRFVLGGTLWQASLFYAAGIFLLFLWRPRAPVRLLQREDRNSS